MSYSQSTTIAEQPEEALRYAPSWMAEQIERDFAAFREGISQESLAYARRCINDRSLPLAYIVSIHGKTVSTYPEKLTKRAGSIVRHLQRVHAAQALPETDFVLGAADAWQFAADDTDDFAAKLPPIFVFSASKDDPQRGRYVLFPDDHTLGDHLIGYRKGWARLYSEMKRKREKHPYDRRKPKAFWRGLATDRVREYPDGRTPRVKLVEFSQQRPDILDAAMTTTPLFNKLVRKNLRALMQMFSIPPYVSYDAQLRYKILPCLDGRANTYPGLLWRLASGSVVIKQETPFQQWFYNLLEPWKDYVPAAKQMEDMIERIEWTLANPKEAQEIAQHGMATVEASLTPAAIDQYLRLVICRHAELSE